MGAAGPTSRGAAEAEPLLDTSVRLVDIKNARRIAQFLTSVIALATFVVLAVHNGTAGRWGGVIDERPAEARPRHGMPYHPIPGRSRLVAHVDDTPDDTRDALRRERYKIDDFVAQLGSADGKANSADTRAAPKTPEKASDTTTATATTPPSTKKKTHGTPPETDWVTPMYLLHVPNDEADEARLKGDLVKLVAAHGVAAVKKNVRLTPSVDATRWPHDLDQAVYALKSVFENLGGYYREPDLSLVKDLPWIKALDARDRRGRLREPWNGGLVASRVSTLFAHMSQWQLAKDNGNEHTYVVNADGLNPWLLSVPVVSLFQSSYGQLDTDVVFHSQGALGSVVRNAPKDYDVVFVNQPLFTGGKLFSRFGDFTGHTVQLHEWEQRGVVGLGTYLFSNRFVDTVRLFMFLYSYGPLY